ncbi:kinase-like protein [Thermothelomyces heterothallicus CBS 203.75]
MTHRSAVFSPSSPSRPRGACVPISRNLIVKTGPFAHLIEAATMRFVACKTSIPVPRMHCAFVHKNRAIIVMDRIRGVSLSRAWKTLSEEDRDGIFGGFLARRSYPPEFHLWLRHGLRPEDHPDHEDDEDWREIKAMVKKQDGPWPPPVFAHGDLNPSNILVRANRVVGIIDWEHAGW